MRLSSTRASSRVVSSSRASWVVLDGCLERSVARFGDSRLSLQGFKDVLLVKLELANASTDVVESAVGRLVRASCAFLLDEVWVPAASKFLLG